MSSVCWFLLFCYSVCVFPFFDLLVWNYLFFIFSRVWLTSSGWRFPSVAFHRTAFVDKILLKFGFIREYIPPSTVIESFASYSILEWHPWSLRVCSNLSICLCMLLGLLLLTLLIFCLFYVCLVYSLLCDKVNKNWVKTEIKKQIKDFLQLNENENTTNQTHNEGRSKMQVH